MGLQEYGTRGGGGAGAGSGASGASFRPNADARLTRVGRQQQSHDPVSMLIAALPISDGTDGRSTAQATFSAPLSNVIMPSRFKFGLCSCCGAG